MNITHEVHHSQYRVQEQIQLKKTEGVIYKLNNTIKKLWHIFINMLQAGI